MLKWGLLIFLLSGTAWAGVCNPSKKGIHLPRPQIPFESEQRLWREGFAEVNEVLCKNLHGPKFFFRGYRAHPAPSYKAAYLWDTAFISQIWMYWDPNIAQELIKYLMRFQEKNGLVHHEVFELLIAPLPMNHTQPPLLAWATWRIFERSQDQNFLRGAYGPLKKYHQWLLKNRRHPDGLYFWYHPYESGIDNSPRFSNASESIKADTRHMAAVDLSSYMAMSMEALAKMARVLGLSDEAQDFEAQYQDLKLKINALLWDARDGLYYDWDYDRGDFVRFNTISGLTPLVAGVATNEQAQILRNRIMDPNQYNTLIPFPSVAKNDPSYSKDMWRGPVWINMAYLGVKGLDRYGYHAEASDLARRIALGIYTTYQNEGHIFEFYDPERHDIRQLKRKKGNLLKRLTLGSKPVKDFVGWSGLANTLVIEYARDWSRE